MKSITIKHMRQAIIHLHEQNFWFKITFKTKAFKGYDMRHKADHTHSTCADLLTLISIVPALDPVPAKCIISSLIKDLLTSISIANA